MPVALGLWGSPYQTLRDPPRLLFLSQLPEVVPAQEIGYLYNGSLGGLWGSRSWEMAPRPEEGDPALPSSWQGREPFPSTLWEGNRTRTSGCDGHTETRSRSPSMAIPSTRLGSQLAPSQAFDTQAAGSRALSPGCGSRTPPPAPVRGTAGSWACPAGLGQQPHSLAPTAPKRCHRAPGGMESCT